MATKKRVKKPGSGVKQSTTLKKAMLQALEQTLGIVTEAARQVGIDRTSHYRWLDQDPAYKKAVESISDIALDFAESALHNQIGSGEVSSTIFYLKTKGKNRGYIERLENVHSGSVVITPITGMEIK